MHPALWPNLNRKTLPHGTYLQALVEDHEHNLYLFGIQVTPLCFANKQYPYLICIKGLFHNLSLAFTKNTQVEEKITATA